MEKQSNTNSDADADAAPAPGDWPDLRAGERHGPTPWRRTPAPGARRWRVAAVMPCFNRHRDIELLLEDLAGSDLDGIDLTVTLVDNASDPPVASVRMPPSLNVDVVRMAHNLGGSGGFSAAMAHVLERRGRYARDEAPDFLLLLDSDVRLTRRAISAMVDVLSSHDELVGVGPELRDPTSGRSYETGGLIGRADGHSRSALVRDSLPYRLVACDYIASCVILVRRQAVERTGLFPETFLYLDDIDWCLAIRNVTGTSFAALPGVVAYHPWWWTNAFPGRRYYIARNCMAPLERLGLGRTARLRRAMTEVMASATLTTLGLYEFAREHLRGLADQAAGRVTGAGRARSLPAPPSRPLSELAPLLAGLEPGTRVFVHPELGAWYFGYEDLREELGRLELEPGDYRLWHSSVPAVLVARSLWEALRRICVGARADVAIVPLDWATGWIHGNRLLVVAGGCFVDLKPDVRQTVPRAVACFIAGLVQALRLWWRGPGPWPLPRPSDQPRGTVVTLGPAIPETA